MKYREGVKTPIVKFPKIIVHAFKDRSPHAFGHWHMNIIDFSFVFLSIESFWIPTTSLRPRTDAITYKGAKERWSKAQSYKDQCSNILKRNSSMERLLTSIKSRYSSSL